MTEEQPKPFEEVPSEEHQLIWVAILDGTRLVNLSDSLAERVIRSTQEDQE